LKEEHVGKLLKRIRKSKRIYISELARLSGISRTYLSTLEAGSPKTITLETANKIANALGVRPEIFLSSEDSEFIYMKPDHFELYIKELRKEYGIPKEEKQ